MNRTRLPIALGVALLLSTVSACSTENTPQQATTDAEPITQQETSASKDSVVSIPPELDADAQSAFAEGQKVFIWSAANEPVEAKNTNIGPYFMFDVNYARATEDDTIPFDVRTVLLTTNADGQPVDILSTRTSGPNDPEPSGKAKSAFIYDRSLHQGTTISGTGYAVIYVFERSSTQEKADDDPDVVISNTIKVKIRFP